MIAVMQQTLCRWGQTLSLLLDLKLMCDLADGFEDMRHKRLVSLSEAFGDLDHP
jgi:hypothetical protein